MVFKLRRLTFVRLCIMIVYNIKIKTSQQRKNKLLYHHTVEKVKIFKVHGSVHRNNILIYIQQDATLGSIFYLETALHVSGGTSNHHQECKQLFLQHLVCVTPLFLSAAIVEELEPV